MAQRFRRTIIMVAEPQWPWTPSGYEHWWWKWSGRWYGWIDWKFYNPNPNAPIVRHIDRGPGIRYRHRFFCKLCDRGFRDVAEYFFHMNSREHYSRMADIPNFFAGLSS